MRHGLILKKVLVVVAVFLTLNFQPSTFNCFADLTTTVAPGHVFSENEQPTTATLNELGQPTVTIAGTVAGATGLTAGSVNGNLLADSVPDGITLTYDISNPRGLTVMFGGLAGQGLISTTTNLTVLADTNYFQFATNSIANTNSVAAGGVGRTVQPPSWLTFKANSLTDTNISASAWIAATKLAVQQGCIVSGAAWTNNLLYLTNSAGAATMLGTGLMITNITTALTLTNGAGSSTTTNWTGPTLVLQQFTSSLYSIPSSGGPVAGVNGVAHGLPTTPSVVRWVLVCQTGEFGYQAGDEADAPYGISDNGNNVACFTGGANSTNVFLSLYEKASSLRITCRTNNTEVTPTTGNWKVKCYARP